MLVSGLISRCYGAPNWKGTAGYKHPAPPEQRPVSQYVIAALACREIPNTSDHSNWPRSIIVRVRDHTTS
jgi:hypothetical protein